MDIEDYAKMGCGCLVVIIVILFIIFTITLGYQNRQTTTCMVEDKWVKNYSSSSTYLVKCGNEVYEVSDLFFIGKFNSSDIYSNLKKNKTYKITTTGYRIPFLSWYKNINSYELVEEK